MQQQNKLSGEKKNWNIQTSNKKKKTQLQPVNNTSTQATSLVFFFGVFSLLAQPFVKTNHQLTKRL